MRNILLESLDRVPVEEQQVELVERKGLGHPDSICDAIMEAISVALCREYMKAFGRVLHHNIDKSLLVAGRTSPRIGGGTVDEPMRLVFGDRAVYEYGGKRIPVGEIATETAKEWIRENLRFVDPEKHLIFQNEIKPGSPELTDIFERKVIGANDTSAAVGYAPMTETEKIVLATEKRLNSPEFKKESPVAGEDIKVMGYRFDRRLILTVALAFVDRFVESEKGYFAQKKEIEAAVRDFVKSKDLRFKDVRVDVNTLDQPGRGEAGMYLTVLGTSAEGADGGQVGRGNKVNGVIALNRPTSTEAAAGKGGQPPRRHRLKFDNEIKVLGKTPMERFTEFYPDEAAKIAGLTSKMVAGKYDSTSIQSVLSRKGTMLPGGVMGKIQKGLPDVAGKINIFAAGF